MGYVEASFWELYRGPVVGGVLFLLLQAILIVSLLVSRAKRQKSEAVAALIADLSTKFINVPPDDLDREIRDAQRRVCESLDLDLSALWQWSVSSSDLVTLTHLYRRLGGGPTIPEPMKCMDYFPWRVKQLREGRIVAVSTMEELPAEAARDREVWREFGIKSNLTFPLSAGGGQIIGALGFNAMQKERVWSEELIRRLQLVAQIFANALTRRRADQALRESEERLSVAADSAEAGLWSLNLTTGNYWLTNKAREILQVPSAQNFTFESFLELVHPADRVSIRRTAAEVMRSKHEGLVEYRVVQGDGTVRWMASRGRVQPGANGQPDCLMGVTVDITPRKQAETALHEAERERNELRNTLAHSARVTLLGQLASALAHQLSQPLGAILRNAEAAELVLQMPSPDLEELRAIIADIRTDDVRAANVIDRLRSLLKRRSLDLQPVEMNGVVTEVLSVVQADAAARHVRLSFRAEEALPAIRGDRIHLQQVLINLLVNAMDALGETAQEERRVQIRASRTKDGVVEVRVCDNGPGIRSESAKALFEPFVTTKANGMGMGLAVCKTIIEAHEGKIWAENQPEGGACFCFTLTAAAAAAVAEAAAGVTEVTEATGATRVTGLTAAAGGAS